MRQQLYLQYSAEPQVEVDPTVHFLTCGGQKRPGNFAERDGGQFAGAAADLQTDGPLPPTRRPQIGCCNPNPSNCLAWGPWHLGPLPLAKRHFNFNRCAYSAGKGRYSGVCLTPARHTIGALPLALPSKSAEWGCKAAVHIVERSMCAWRDEQPVGAADGGGCAVHRTGQPGLRGDTGHAGEQLPDLYVAQGGSSVTLKGPSQRRPKSAQPIQAPLAGSLCCYGKIWSRTRLSWASQNGQVWAPRLFQNVWAMPLLLQQRGIPGWRAAGVLFATQTMDGRQGGRVGTGGQLPQVGLGRQFAVVNAGPNTARAATGGKGQSGLFDYLPGGPQQKAQYMSYSYTDWSKPVSAPHNRPWKGR